MVSHCAKFFLKREAIFFLFFKLNFLRKEVYFFLKRVERQPVDRA